MKAVFFDVGETLLDESRAWMGWADWLGVSALTMLGLLRVRAHPARATLRIDSLAELPDALAATSA